MPKLVDKPRSALDAEAVEKLMELIDTSVNRDRKYFRALRVWRDMVKGDQWGHFKNAPKKQEVRAVVNLAYAHVKTLLPTIFFQKPTVKTMPTHKRHQGKERIWDAVINNTNEKIGMAKELKEVVMDSIIFPHGYAKTIVNRGDTREASSEEDREGPTEWLSKDTPAFVRLSPNQVIVDYLSPGRRLDQARFVAIRYKKTLADLERDGRYKIPKDIRIRFKGTFETVKNSATERSRDPFDDFEGSSDQSTAQDEMVTIYEVWVHQISHLNLYQQMFVLMEGLDVPIRQPVPWSDVMGEGFDEYPIDEIALNPIPDETAISDLQVWEQLQVGVNWLMSRLIGLVSNEKQVWEFDHTKVKNPEKAKRAFMHGGHQPIIDVNELGAFNLVQPTFPGRDNYTLMQTMLSMIQQVSGFGSNRRGGSGIRTATEADLVEQGIQIKTSEKVEVIREFLAGLIRKEVKVIRGIVSRYAGTDWIFRIGGETGRVNWLEFTIDDLNWMPDVYITVDSFRRTESPAEAQKLMSAISVGLQMMNLGLPVRVDELYRRLLVALGINDSDLIMNDDLEDAMQQMAEIVLLLQGQPVEAKESDNHPSHLRVLQAFKNSQLYQTLAVQNPGSVDSLDQHEQLHTAMLDQQTRRAQSAAQGTNPFDEISFERDAATPGPSPQSEANQSTAPDRLAFGNGQGSALQ